MTLGSPNFELHRDALNVPFEGARLGAANGGDNGGRLMMWGGRLLLVLAVILLIRVLALLFNATDLFFDEAQYWSWSLDPAFGYYSKPPLIAWVIGLSSAVCGDSEFCVRLPSPLLHTLSAFAVFAVGARLYGAKTGFWSGVVFATLPGVSFSSGLISTDVPLLLFWAIALFAFVAFIDERDRWWPAVLLGLALGCGLNAKYAMAYFILCAVVYAIATPHHRWILWDRRWWFALLVGALMILPNLVWNYQHSFATFAHTADNAKWGGPLLHPNKAVEFFVAQFGVFGPVLFGALLVIAVRAYRIGLPRGDRFLLAFALPMLLIITVQAFLSRAHANWAAVSYVAATVLVTATMVRELSWRWLGASLGLHAAVMLGLGIVMSQARTLAVPGVQNPFARTLGWRSLAKSTKTELQAAQAAGRAYGSIVTADRSVTAELLYYLRGSDDGKGDTPNIGGRAIRILAWPPIGRPHDHYQLTRPLSKTSPGPMLLVTIGPPPKSILARFSAVGRVKVVRVRTGVEASRPVNFVRVSGFLGRRPRVSRASRAFKREWRKVLITLGKM